MSRSFKRAPVYKDGSNRSKIKKNSKKQANRKVRKWRGALGKSNEYRKLWEQWDICDYRFYKKKPDSNEKEEYSCWKKYYLRK